MLEYLYIDHTRISADNLESFARQLSPQRAEVLHDTLSLLKEWWDPRESLTVQTSGSTGTPKLIELHKDAMRRSALRSNSYFGIREGHRLLLAMSLRYIGAKMMVVRAVIAHAELIVVPPSSHPLATLTKAPQFISLVPLQIHHTLQEPAESQLLCQAEQVIIGGGAIHPAVETEIRSLPISVYATYGMTETISHIAIRKISSVADPARFYPLSGVSLSMGSERQLIIRDELLYPQGRPIITHDLVELHADGAFTILGRTDYIINSGGVKVSPEVVERQLANDLQMPLAISWIPDIALGQRLVLVLQSDHRPSHLGDTIQKLLPPYHRPKEILLITQLPYNDNGKLDRRILHQMVVNGTLYNIEC